MLNIITYSTKCFCHPAEESGDMSGQLGSADHHIADVMPTIPRTEKKIMELLSHHVYQQ